MLIPFLRALLWTLPFVSGSLLVSCACEKNVSLGEWCRDQSDQCEGLGDYDAAVKMFADSCVHSPWTVRLRTCGETTSIVRGDGYVGRVLTYDGKGRLVAGSTYTDSPDSCPAPSGGQMPELDPDSCTTCQLCVGPASYFEDGVCDPKLATKAVEACVADAPSTFEGECRSCACNECYAASSSIDEQSDWWPYADDIAREFAHCAEDRCEACDPQRVKLTMSMDEAPRT